MAKGGKRESGGKGSQPFAFYIFRAISLGWIMLAVCIIHSHIFVIGVAYKKNNTGTDLDYRNLNSNDKELELFGFLCSH